MGPGPSKGHKKRPKNREKFVSGKERQQRHGVSGFSFRGEQQARGGGMAGKPSTWMKVCVRIERHKGMRGEHDGE